MAKSRAHCSTPGCKNTLELIGRNRAEADRKAEWLEAQGFVCKSCKQDKLEEENQQAARLNAEAGLLALAGSEKQILWAEKIRADKLDVLAQAVAGQFDGLRFDAYFGGEHQAIAIDDPGFGHAIALLKSQLAASWWIDQRGEKVGVLLRDLFVAHPPGQPVAAEEADLVMEIQAEATVRTESPHTETVAEIHSELNRVSVVFPEKLEKFRLLLRENGYKWTGEAWERQLSDLNGTVTDRAAEIGHTLLANGFVIRIYNESIRALAISGKFKPEQTRWIRAYTSGKESGRLCLSWGFHDNCYKAAKRLPGSRYVKPNVSVGSEQWEQVLDFAELHHFSITPEAQSLIDTAKAAKEAALVAAVEAKPKPKRKKAETKPAKLDVPDEVEIDHDLRD